MSQKEVLMPTEKPIADVVLLYKVSKQLLVFAILVGNLGRNVIRHRVSSEDCEQTTYRGIPERTAKFDSFQENRLRLLKVEICPHRRIEAHGPKAGNRDLLVAKRECLSHSW